MPQDGEICPRVLHRPLLPAETEALSIAGSPAAWRTPAHPRFKSQTVALDWPAARALHNPAMAPWSLVRPLLLTLEAAAGSAKADEGERRSEEDPE